LLKQVVSSTSGISLLVAALDLKLVRSIRDAIRTADIHSGRTGPRGTFPPLEPSPRKQVEPEPRFEPRVVYHPTPRFEPRPVVHCRPIAVEPCDRQTLAPLEPEPQPCRTKCPLPAPWQESVWKTPIPAASEVKVHLHRTDVVHKGSLIDLFI
jgi:hypothetical protein